MARYNIIGDIHGRDSWKRLVRADSINIFVGDYLDPREELSVRTGETPESAALVHLRNFIEILDYKKNHPETVLLLGNHDVQYLHEYGPETNLYDAQLAPTIDALMSYADMEWRIAYAIEDKILVTHAGVTTDWMHLMGAEENAVWTPNSVAKWIQKLVLRDKSSLYASLSMASCAEPGDFRGNSPTASPIWIRPKVLCEHNVFKDQPYVQVVGHTNMKEISKVGNVFFIDCLRYVPQSLVIDTTNGIKYKINQ